MTRRVSEGSAEPLGVVPDALGINVAVFSRNAEAIELCLFDEADREVERVRLPARTGDVVHGHVAGIGVGARYGLRAHGPYAPGDGHRFNPAKLLIDPHAHVLDRPFKLDGTMFGYHPDGDDRWPEPTDSAPAMPKAVVATHAGPASPRPLWAWDETILYELHIRGFTRRHLDVPEAIRGTFAGLAHPAAIAHLAKLSITSVEIMPCAAWIEERHLAKLGLSNYWGYNPVALMAPEPRLAPGGWGEIRAAVAALAEAGIETIVDVVLNHSGEGDAFGPTLSLRGLDNASYYRVRPDNRAGYIDDAGCGNTLALDRAPVVRLAMDALRTWVREAGVHGFRFDLATAMGRRPDGFDREAPLLAAIAQDPELGALKLIAEPWDIGPGGYQVGNFPAGWGEWNDRFRDDVRRFWRGDVHHLGRLATRLAGSADVFGRARRPSRGINFVTAHDGFALADLVAHETKRNEANGEDNRDGCNDNFSWNAGCEGASDDPTIRAARARDQRALTATLLFARGTPMLAMGAELGHSQQGNNNCYAQDNALSWLDWSQADPALLAFAQEAAALRRRTPLLRRDAVLDEGEVAWLSPAGAAMTPTDWDAPGAGSVAMLLGEPGRRVGILVHRGHRPCRFVLPGGKWRVLLASDRVGDDAGGAVDLAPRSVAVVGEKPDRAAVRGVSGATLARLARAAGIHDDWWTVDGVRHVVGDDTRRHLLAAMRLDAGSEGEAWDSLERLAEARARRPLPPVVVAGEGERAALPLAGDDALRRSAWVRIEAEDGTEVCVLASSEAIDAGWAEDCSGRPFRRALLPLPPLPLGRYTVTREDAPDHPCRLTIAPRRAFLPDAIPRGERLFGLSAQLYALRRDGDQGIGDFATLAELARRGAQAGAAVIAINPLHALFFEQRERASPYSPSDRRFLDPIYLDVGPLAALPGNDMIDYPEVWARKEAVLRARFAAAPPQPDADAALTTFATFAALARR
ncbi:MAG: glycogen debranching protein GlgX, partial [Novosphingobium sp.]